MSNDIHVLLNGLQRAHDELGEPDLEAENERLRAQLAEAVQMLKDAPEPPRQGWEQAYVNWYWHKRMPLPQPPEGEEKG